MEGKQGVSHTLFDLPFSKREAAGKPTASSAKNGLLLVKSAGDSLFQFACEKEVFHFFGGFEEIRREIG